MKPAIAPREWQHVSIARHSNICGLGAEFLMSVCAPVCYRLQAVSNVSRMHRLALASHNSNAVAPIAIAVGAKNAGKSTFCQLLLNSLLAQRADASVAQGAPAAGGAGRGPGGIVAYLDLDPGQCEFTAAGMISLVVVLDRNLYPPPCPVSAASDGPFIQQQDHPEIPAALRHLDEYLLRAIF